MTSPSSGERRRYDNTRRSEQAAATRDRILDAGCELVRESDVRDWRELTMAAVAERSGVSARTVYRHFASEHGMRRAVMAALEQRAGIDLAHLTLDGVADAAARIFSEVAAYRTAPSSDPDPLLTATGARQRDALLGAVGEVADGWSESERAMASAVLDVLWSPAAYERLVGSWQMSPDAATAALTWAVRLVAGRVVEGKIIEGKIVDSVDITTNS